MGVPYAEVIGDPIAHSKSPIIHRFWLRKLGMDAEFRPVRVHATELQEYFAARRGDPQWRGCSVTAPHKVNVIDCLDSFSSAAVAVGAVNCVHRSERSLIGTNTDVDGVSAVFDIHPWEANRVTLLGAGGAARAVLEVLRQRLVLEVFMVVRDPEQARPLHAQFARSGSVHSFARPHISFSGTQFVVNATPLGMAGAAEMPGSVLEALAKARPTAVVFDMVYAPVDTELLKRARALSLKTVTGLQILIAQARSAFQYFFGVEPSDVDDAELLRELTQ